MNRKLNEFEKTPSGLSDVNLTLEEVVVPVIGALNYINRTSNRYYTNKEALEVHFNRWVLTGINLAYVVSVVMVGNFLAR